MTSVNEIDIKTEVIDNSDEPPAASTSSDAETSVLPPSDLSKFENDFEAFINFAFPEDNQMTNCASSLDPFYFESDHIALKGNEDYCHLLRTFVTLESQRITAVHDLDTLLEQQKKALENPLQFAKELQSGTFKGRCPGRIKVADLPNIAWERYTSDVEAVLCSLGGSHHSTRQKQKRELLSGIRETITTSSRVSRPSSSSGRTSPSLLPTIKTEPSMPKTATFNQSWSSEEQQQLERLLQKYPPERFESRRFAKIAAELKGRTLQQVASRVQKYFIKLAKAGLPIPGRVPNLAAHGGRGLATGYHRHQRYNRFYYPSSTFLTSYVPPVYMSDDEGNDPTDGFCGLGPSGSSECEASLMSSDDDEEYEDSDLLDVPDDLRESSEFRELRMLTAVRRESRQRPTTSVPDGNQCLRPSNVLASSSFSKPFAQTAVKSEPISDDPSSIFEASTASHRTHIDLDYTSAAKTGINSYLDPNYMPAV